MFEWLMVMFPLVFSPGPANIIASISGARVGIKKSIPLFLGINVIYVSYSLIVGLGVGRLLISAPGLMKLLQYSGALFIIWLGAVMWIRSKNRDSSVHLGFREGLIIQATNPKFIIILVTMYSVFLTAQTNQMKQVVILTLSILILNVFTQISWAFSGHLFGKYFSSNKANQIQDRIFSVLLIIVGIWIAFRD